MIYRPRTTRVSQLVEQGWPFRAKDQVMVVHLVRERREKKRRKKHILWAPSTLSLSSWIGLVDYNTHSALNHHRPTCKGRNQLCIWWGSLRIWHKKQDRLII